MSATAFPASNTLDPIQFYALCLGLLLAALWITGR
jgi:hypothetical protein